MNILFGHYVADEGSISVAGPDGALAPLTPGSPQAALDAGVGMVHQHFALAESLTVLENVVLGTRPLGSLKLDLAGARKKLVALMADSGLDVPPDRRVSRLSVGEKQRLEILKVLYRGARILVLDEPTAVLTPQEVEGLFVVLRRLVRERSLDHLHLAQDERGAGDRGPHRGAARRRARSRTAPPRAPTARPSPN